MADFFGGVGRGQGDGVEEGGTQCNHASLHLQRR